MSNKIIQFSSIIDGVTKKKDGTLSIKLGTQELDPQDTARIFELGNMQIWSVFSDVEITEDDLDIPEALSEFRTDKTPSQRLRNTLWIYWEKHKKGVVEWDTFYKNQMEKIIEYIKEKLEG